MAGVINMVEDKKDNSKFSDFVFGKNCTVFSKIPGLIYKGQCQFYGVYDKTLVLGNYKKMRMEKGKWKVESQGKTVVIKSDGWVCIEMV